jgi:hypothetical protein
VPAAPPAPGSTPEETPAEPTGQKTAEELEIEKRRQRAERFGIPLVEPKQPKSPAAKKAKAVVATAAKPDVRPRSIHSLSRLITRVGPRKTECASGALWDRAEATGADRGRGPRGAGETAEAGRAVRDRRKGRVDGLPPLHTYSRVIVTDTLGIDHVHLTIIATCKLYLPRADLRDANDGRQ